jgi:hypothetical protein
MSKARDLADFISDSTIETAEIADGAVTAGKLNVTGNGTLGQALTSDADGSFSWTTITSDLVDDASPQLGADLDTNGNDITFGNNDKAIFGAGSDLQIYHDGTNSQIRDLGTGDLYIQASAAVNFTNTNASETYAVLNENGAVTLYHNNNAKFSTTATGIDVTGTITADDLLTLESASSYRPEVRLKNTNSDNTAPYVVLQKASASPANNDALGIVLFQGDDSTGTQTNYAEIQGISSNITNGSEQGAIKLRTAQGALLDRLTIEGNGDISFYEDTGTTPKLFWDASEESLGIGTSSPGQKLEILRSGGGRIRLSETSDRYVEIIGYAEGTANGSTMGFNTIESGTSTLTERMRINHSGNVGIGTTSPSAPLTVNTGAATDGKLRIESNSITGQGSELFFSGSNASAGAGFASISVNRGGNNTSAHDGLKFNVSPSWSTSAPVEVMRIDSSGRVGIGTSSPSHPLHVLATAAGETTVKFESNQAGAMNVALDVGADRDCLLQFQEAGTTRWDIFMNGSSGTNPLLIRDDGGTTQGSFDQSGNFKFNSGYGSAATAYGCRAWVQIDGAAATPSISGSGNVSSITDNGTGHYTVNFTTSMPDNNYSATANATKGGGTETQSNSSGVFYREDTVLSGSIQIYVMTFSGTKVDRNRVSVAVFR